MLKTLLIVSSLAVFVSAICSGPCNKHVQHYKEIGCTPIGDDSGCCADCYDCPELSSRDASKCYYKGKMYGVEQEIASEDYKTTCVAGVRCTESGTKGVSRFLYAHIDCAEFFMPLKPGCIRQYDAKACCAKNTICGDDKKKLATCTLDGETFYEGQRMYPNSNKCKTCICQKGFDSTNILGNPNCWDQDCGLELLKSDDLKNGCIPVYCSSGRNCCPSGWRCPDAKDAVIKGNDTKLKSDFKCKFGNLLLDVGDTLNTGINTFARCSCKVPPMAECEQDC